MYNVPKITHQRNGVIYWEWNGYTKRFVPYWEGSDFSLEQHDILEGNDPDTLDVDDWLSSKIVPLNGVADY